MTDVFHPADVRHHVENLLATYAEHADVRDADGVTELLHSAAVTFAGVSLQGADDIHRHYTMVFASAPVCRHLLSNIIVDVPAADRAVARCRYSRWAIGADADLLTIGDYAATFALHGEAWQFTAFTVSPAWTAQR